MGRRTVGRPSPLDWIGWPGVFLALALLAGGGAAFAQAVFKVDVRLVRLLVTVQDEHGKPVGGLESADFTVYDSGVPQTVALFERHTEQPLSVALLVDISASTAQKLGFEVESVGRFLRALFAEGNPDDAAALYSFDHDVTLLSSFTRRLARLEAVLRQLRAGSGTSLYDAIYLASGGLEHRSGRRVLVVVTDGGDTTSRQSYHDALRAAHRAEAAIYSILVMPITNDPGRNIGGEHAMTTLSRDTGGRIFLPSLGPALDEAFDQVLRDLRTQYLIGYYPKDLPYSKDPFHRLRVELKDPRLRALTRTGYYRDYIASDREPGSHGSRLIFP